MTIKGSAVLRAVLAWGKSEGSYVTCRRDTGAGALKDREEDGAVSARDGELAAEPVSSQAPPPGDPPRATP